MIESFGKLCFLCHKLCLLCKVTHITPFSPPQNWTQMENEWICKLHSGRRPSTSTSVGHPHRSHSSLLPFVLAQSLCFGLLFPFTSTLSGYSNCVSLQTQQASRLHTGAPALGLLRKQRLISGRARCVHPVWPLSLPRTSKPCGFVGHSSGWIEVRDGACIPGRRQVFAKIVHDAFNPSP